MPRSQNQQGLIRCKTGCSRGCCCCPHWLQMPFALYAQLLIRWNFRHAKLAHRLTLDTVTVADTDCASDRFSPLKLLLQTPQVAVYLWHGGCVAWWHGGMVACWHWLLKRLLAKCQKFVCQNWEHAWKVPMQLGWPLQNVNISPNTKFASSCSLGSTYLSEALAKVKILFKHMPT